MQSIFLAVVFLYEDFSVAKKRQFSAFCCKQVRNLYKGRFYIRPFRWVQNKINPKPFGYYYKEKKIAKNFYAIQDRIFADPEINKHFFANTFPENQAKKIAKDYIHKKNKFDLEEYDIEALVSIYRAYIKFVMNGLIPLCLKNVLLHLGTKNRFTAETLYTKHKNVIKYLPFAMPENEKNVLMKVIGLLNAIEADPVESGLEKKFLVNSIAPTIFGFEFCKRSIHKMIAQDITSILTRLDFTNIDMCVYNQFTEEIEKRQLRRK